MQSELFHINRKKIDATRTEIWEFEKAGYIVRWQRRDEKGKMSASVYIIRKQLRSTDYTAPMLENSTKIKIYQRLMYQPKTNQRERSRCWAAR